MLLFKKNLDRKILTSLLFLVIALATLMRIYSLEVRPLHHDESIHATFSYNWYKDSHNFYSYDPTYHGPFLYVVGKVIFDFFGTGVAEARLPPLVFGILILLLPFLLVPIYGFYFGLVAALLLAISPHFVYYSTFLAHDMPVIFFSFLSLICLIYLSKLEFKIGRGQVLWSGLFSISIGCLFSIKLISHIWIFVLLTYAIFFYVFVSSSIRRSVSHVIFSNKMSLLGFFLIFLVGFNGFYSLFQTSLNNNFDGYLDGLYRKSISHWWEMHNVERLKGPVYYHLRSLVLLELPLLGLVGTWGAANLCRLRSGRLALILLGVLGLAVIPFSWSLQSNLPESLLGPLQALKLSNSADLFVYGLAFVFGILLTNKLIKEGRWFSSFLSYWSFAALAIYSFAGEKGPWLTVHIVLPLSLLAAISLNDFFTSPAYRRLRKPLKFFVIVLAAFCILYQLRLSYIVTYVSAGNRRDLLSQVHNDRDILTVLEDAKLIAAQKNILLVDLPIAIIGKPVWAFYYYLLSGGYRRFIIEEAGIDGSQELIVLGEEEHKKLEEKLTSDGYVFKVMKNDGWFVPEFAQMTWANWIRYAWDRSEPGFAGGSRMFVYTKAP